MVIESARGLLLVDTALGLSDVAQAKERLGGGFLAMARPRLDAAECAASQIEKLGYRREDVRDIAVTHLDKDHAGGLADFPDARVHVTKQELDDAMQPVSLHRRERYRRAQFVHGPKWQAHVPGGERWFGFESVKAIVEPEVLLVPLHGHTRGHAAVGVRTESGWVLHCGDAYFHHEEMAESPRCPAALRAFQRLLAVDDEARRANQARLRALKKEHGGEIRIFCAHSPVELEAAQ